MQSHFVVLRFCVFIRLYNRTFILMEDLRQMFWYIYCVYSNHCNIFLTVISAYYNRFFRIQLFLSKQYEYIIDSPIFIVCLQQYIPPGLDSGSPELIFKSSFWKNFFQKAFKYHDLPDSISGVVKTIHLSSLLFDTRQIMWFQNLKCNFFIVKTLYFLNRFCPAPWEKNSPRNGNIGREQLLRKSYSSFELWKPITFKRSHLLSPQPVS